MAARPFLDGQVALAVGAPVGTAGGVLGGLDQRPAQMRRTLLGEPAATPAGGVVGGHEKVPNCGHQEVATLAVTWSRSTPRLPTQKLSASEAGSIE